MNVGLALDSFPSQSVTLHLDLLTFPTEEIQISLVCHFISGTWLIYLFNFFFFFGHNAIQFQLNTIPSSMSNGGKKEEIKGKARHPYFSEPTIGRVQGRRSAPRTAPSLPAVPQGLLHLPHSPTGAINHPYETSPTHIPSLSSQLSLRSQKSHLLIISLHLWALIWEINKHNYHRITEYCNLKGPHKNHSVQVPVPHRTT